MSNIDVSKNGSICVIHAPLFDRVSRLSIGSEVTRSIVDSGTNFMSKVLFTDLKYDKC